MGTQTNIVKYAVLPGIIPRIFAFFRSGFVHTAYIMAVIYSNVRLLPADHPYLIRSNIGHYGLRHVIAAAANNLVFSRKNIDQIIIFFTILTGLILLCAQFILFIVAIILEHPAQAFNVVETANLFNNPNGTTGSLGPAQDIAFVILDRVFGVEGIFNSCISATGIECKGLQGQDISTPTNYPFPFHLALHQILQFYSTGIFMVGVLIILYYFVAIIAETAQTGTPFGQRFNKAWAPVRLVVFFALIIPITTGDTNRGFNLAQIITFQTVKLGSNFATNGWAFFNGAGTETNSNNQDLLGASASYLSQQKDIIASPNAPIREINDLIQAIHVAKVCATVYNLNNPPLPGQTKQTPQVGPYLVRAPPPGNATGIPDGDGANKDSREATQGSFPSYEEAVAFNYGQNIAIVFGYTSNDATSPGKGLQLDKIFNKNKGGIRPECGEITLQLQGRDEAGAEEIFKGYYGMIDEMWNDEDINNTAKYTAQRFVSNNNNFSSVADATKPTKTFAANIINKYTEDVNAIIQAGIEKQKGEGEFNLPEEILARGWGGAALWYNRIAAMNGAVTSATFNIPKMSRIPFLMDISLESAKKQNASVDPETAFTNTLADSGLNLTLDISEAQQKQLNAMITTRNFWINGGYGGASNFEKATGNALIDFINLVLGTHGLFEIRQNTDVHPLAQITALGKGMMDATIRNAGFATGLTIANVLHKDARGGSIQKTAEDFFFSMTIATMGMAVILYYIVPFLPFIYFMFAISGWVKSIFEAIVAMPLWALAHIRIEGEGLPGQDAANGYFLLLEIFLRPILIIFGFIASITIFSALVSVLNQIFDLVVSNLGGSNIEFEINAAEGSVVAALSKIQVSRGPIDEFFFTAMYTIIVYLIGLASFKLIDLIPQSILRWIGVSVSTFQENAGDPAGQLSSNVYKGTTLLGNQVKGATSGNLALLTT